METAAAGKSLKEALAATGAIKGNYVLEKATA